MIYVYTLLIPYIGLIVGAAIRYSASSKPLVHLEVEPEPNSQFNQTLPPDTLWLKVS